MIRLPGLTKGNLRIKIDVLDSTVGRGLGVWGICKNPMARAYLCGVIREDLVILNN